MVTGARCLNAYRQSLLCHVHEAFRFCAHLPHRNRNGGIAVVAFVNGAHVKLDEIPFDQPTLSRYAVHHFMIDRYTHASWKVVDVREGRVSSLSLDRPFGN